MHGNHSTHFPLHTGQIVYDPRGHVEAEAIPLAPRVPTLSGLRVGVLDNTKWNANKLLRQTISLLEDEFPFAHVRWYTKDSFSRNAAPELIERIVTENDVVITAIGD